MEPREELKADLRLLAWMLAASVVLSLILLGMLLSPWPLLRDIAMLHF
jgi:hypothetical protein